MRLLALVSAGRFYCCSERPPESSSGGGIGRLLIILTAFLKRAQAQMPMLRSGASVILP